MKKIESVLLREISTYILEKRIKDPRIASHLTVNRAVVSKDLQYAKIYISSFETEQKLNKGVDGLNHAAGFIQNLLGKKLKTRNTPKLTFFADTSIKEGYEINKMIERALH
jgi:ribosome-binding factor A